MNAPAKQPKLATEFAGSPLRLGRMVLVTGALTLLTLGLYGFWGKARLRRWYWSAIRPGGMPLEYTGNGFETFTSFLWTIVFLILWFGVASTVFVVAGVSLWGDPRIGPALTLGLLVPIWLWVRFKRRSYIISRTRWRGLRFRVEARGVAYVMRVFWHLLLTILTLGLLWPRMTYRLEAFRTERTFYGVHQIRQGGRWQMLFPAYVPAYLTLLAMAGIGYVAATMDARAVAGFAPLGVLFLLFALRYRLKSQHLMIGHKTIGAIRLGSAAVPRRVMRIAIFNGVAIGVILALPLVLIAAVLIAVRPDATLPDPSALMAMGPVVWGGAGVGLVLLIAAMLLAQVLRHVLIVMPIRRYYASSLTISGRELSQGLGRPKSQRRKAQGKRPAPRKGAKT